MQRATNNGREVGGGDRKGGERDEESQFRKKVGGLSG